MLQIYKVILKVKIKFNDFSKKYYNLLSTQEVIYMGG